MKEFKARHAIGKPVRGTALTANDGFSARYDLDRDAGVFSRPAHKLAGQSYVGEVLVLDTAKGGVASAWMLHEMASRQKVPLAVVFNTVNPILAQGAAFGGITMLAGVRRKHHCGGAERSHRGDRSPHEDTARPGALMPPPPPGRGDDVASRPEGAGIRLLADAGFLRQPRFPALDAVAPVQQFVAQWVGIDIHLGPAAGLRVGAKVRVEQRE